MKVHAPGSLYPLWQVESDQATAFCESETEAMEIALRLNGPVTKHWIDPDAWFWPIKTKVIRSKAEWEAEQARRQQAQEPKP